MKTTIIIFSIFILFCNFAHATPKKRDKIEALETALKSCLSDKETITDTIIVYSGKEAVKVAKQVEKTKRKASIQNTKVVKIENKTEVKTDKFKNFMSGLTKMTALLVAGGFLGGGVVLTKILQFAKQKVPFLKWLPI